VPSPGTYTVLVTPAAPTGTGSYRVRRDKEPPDVIPILTLATGASGRFARNAARAYYSLVVPSRGHLLLTLDDLDNLGANELYLGRGAIPSAGSYDYRFTKAGAELPTRDRARS
jgi:hypothetical protein